MTYRWLKRKLFGWIALSLVASCGDPSQSTPPLREPLTALKPSPPRIVTARLRAFVLDACDWLDATVLEWDRMILPELRSAEGQIKTLQAKQPGNEEVTELVDSFDGVPALFQNRRDFLHSLRTYRTTVEDYSQDGDLLEQLSDLKIDLSIAAVATKIPEWRWKSITMKEEPSLKKINHELEKEGRSLDFLLNQAPKLLPKQP
jgi:hypothetical protein